VTRSDDASNEDLDERVRAAKAAVLTQVDREKLEGIHTRLRTLEASQGMSTGRLESLEGWRKVTMAIVGAVAVAALGSLWTAYTAARDAGNRDGRVDTQIEALKSAVDKVETQIESLWRVRVRSSTGDLP
jgi:chaperonin cofactor prefoldin